MLDVIVGMKTDIEMLKSAFGRALTVGPISELDAAKGYRLDLGQGSDGKRHLSPWYPHPESGGATRTWMPLAKGQIVGVLNPTGDPRRGLVFRGGFSGQYPPPSDDFGENVLEFGGVRISVAEGTLVVTIGETIVRLTGSSIFMDAAGIEIGL
ncbi:baseplate assembly protein [Amorphus orientalis]|uniref:Phage baseplate assembly protein gpV n=1 Tax=Amorphus orientalis TaxID=649198 RepID=A0AAE4AS45_9HYPH|nr:baseplate assembly protein [Amorphus orientalis]MDQ0314848.1 phage baseplate assembly protein gpV [Amorphus orientalis]